ncbi:MAG: MoaD/ThiS family protein [Candidatus Eremiobacteraeota bacterium]|nr:MoaD/ThiS family protein [Candidatus Eremiobacteraeota bacterium]
MEAPSTIAVRILAFARVRELIGMTDYEVDLPVGASIQELFEMLVSQTPDLAQFRASIRFARNGEIVDAGTELTRGDEIALLPPVGGG